MSREIKFRVWDVLNKKIHTWEDLQNENGKGDFLSICNAANQETQFVQLMQYTGLKDKNGAEIYEGDVIQLSFETILMDGYVKAQENGEWIIYKDKGNCLNVHSNKEHIAVIGNIYENENLLNVTA